MLRSKGHSIEPPPSRLVQSGLQTIVDKDPESADPIDIVAIHGLNGHWDTTWTDESTKKNWLRDFLPGVFPTARILSFSYNSAVQFSKAVADVTDFADQLLSGLDSAFNRMQEDKRYSHFRGPTQGVLFFGTPHRGSNVASIGGMFGGMLRSLSLGTSTNLQLLKDLEASLHSHDMYAYDLKANVALISMRVIDVVAKESAILGAKNETAIPMDGDHRTICRFTSGNEPRFRIVVAELASIIQQCLSINQQVSDGVFLGSLGQFNYQQQKDRNPPAVPGTCSWIFSRKEYGNWMKSPISSLMWLSANPGCGKSVTCSFLIDNIEKKVSPSRMFVCYWFFKSDNNQQSSAVSALQGLLRQTLELHPRMTTAVKAAMTGRLLDNIENLWTALTVAAGCDKYQTRTDGAANNEPNAKPEQFTTICILDGLDECTPPDKKDLLSVISKFYQQAGHSSVPTHGILKILVASRPENSIKVVFDKLQNSLKSSPSSQPADMTSYGVIRLKGEDESDSISGDVSLVIRATIKDLIDQGLPESLLSRIERQLILRADRTFLWTTLILQLLTEKVEAGASRRELEEILQSRNIDSIFVEFLRSRPDAPKTRKLFSIILAATEPLTVGQLSIALAVIPEHDALGVLAAKPFRPGPESLDDLEYDIVYPFENHIRAIGGHFIRIIQDKVYFVHETAREFLLRPKQQQEEIPEPQPADSDFEEITLFEAEMESSLPPQSAWQQSFSSAPCHAHLLDICVTYLYMIGKSVKQAEGLRRNKHLLEFLPYAARSWSDHFRRVSPGIQSVNVPYYHNLCHPLFPGFAAWTHEYLDHKDSLVSGLSDDEVQDYFITLLGVGVAEDDEAQNQRHGRDRDTASLHAEAITEVLSSNPTAGSNYNFPVAADENGFVALDFSRAPVPKQRNSATYVAEKTS
ncbi:FabD/lysophospholipase-like protein [Apiospora hydei]|uniref:FabD/lysophospholipase-like protein n=1 Tax=Apiospora hydei TaxID=1337664 RepID=A0ABR1W8I1_9PEZI